MQRYNPFNLIHKALRAMMYDTALTLQQTHFADVEEAEVALSKVEAVISQFEQHADHEDTFVLPAVEAYEPELAEAFESEHVEDIEIGNRLKTLLDIYRSVETSEERSNCGSAINKSFREFMVFNLEHMAKEEVEINRVMWANYTDEQLHQITEKITARIPPAEKMIGAKWMMRGINKADAISWLKAVKQTTPPVVFEGLCQMAETELPVQIRSAVLEAVMEDELVF